MDVSLSAYHFALHVNFVRPPLYLFQNRALYVFLFLLHYASVSHTSVTIPGSDSAIGFILSLYGIHLWCINTKVWFLCNTGISDPIGTSL